MKRVSVLLGVAIVVASLAVGCGQTAPAPAPTQAPAKAVQPTQAPAAPTKAAAPAAPTAAPTAAAKKVEWPEKGKSITVIVPFAPGGAVDTGARTGQPLLEKDLGVPVQVVNKAGASTQIAMTDLVGSKPDGYTVGFMSMATIMVTIMDPERKANYTRKSFQPIAGYSQETIVVAVRGDGPYKTLKDLVDAAKAKPETIKMAGSGLMGNTHLLMLAFEKEAGVKLAIVHFDGAAPAVTALLGGHIDAVMIGSGALTQHVKSGAIRVLGISDKNESVFFPGVKTMPAQGYNVAFTPSYSLHAPAGTPKEVVDIMSASVKKALADAELQKVFLAGGLITNYMTPEQFNAYWDETEKTMGPLLQNMIDSQKQK